MYGVQAGRETEGGRRRGASSRIPGHKDEKYGSITKFLIAKLTAK